MSSAHHHHSPRRHHQLPHLRLIDLAMGQQGHHFDPVVVFGSIAAVIAGIAALRAVAGIGGDDYDDAIRD